MTDIVKVAEWMSEQGLHLEPYTLDCLEGNYINLYLFQETQWDDIPVAGWERLEGDLKRGLFHTEDGMSFWVTKEEHRPRAV